MDNLMMLYSNDLQARYNTVLDAISYELNSFYDSYNSLVEKFLKEFLNEKNGSIFTILNKNKDYLLNEIKFDKKSFNKFLDYANKINHHKHKKENTITLDNVINYMKVFYDLVYSVSLYKKYTIPKFNEEYFKKLYGDKDNSVIFKELSVIEHQNFIHSARQSFINKTLNKTFYYILLTIYFISLIFYVSFNYNSEYCFGYVICQIPFHVLALKFNHFKKEVNNVEYFSYFRHESGLYFLNGYMKMSHWIITILALLFNVSIIMTENNLSTYISLIINSLTIILMFYNVSRIIKGYDIICFSLNNKKKFFSVSEKKWINE